MITWHPSLLPDESSYMRKALDFVVFGAKLSRAVLSASGPKVHHGNSWMAIIIVPSVSKININNILVFW